MENIQKIDFSFCGNCGSYVHPQSQILKVNDEPIVLCHNCSELVREAKTVKECNCKNKSENV